MMMENGTGQEFTNEVKMQSNGENLHGNDLMTLLTSARVTWIQIASSGE